MPYDLNNFKELVRIPRVLGIEVFYVPGVAYFYKARVVGGMHKADELKEIVEKFEATGLKFDRLRAEESELVLYFKERGEE